MFFPEWKKQRMAFGEGYLQFTCVHKKLPFAMSKGKPWALDCSFMTFKDSVDFPFFLVHSSLGVT